MNHYLPICAECKLEHNPNYVPPGDSYWASMDLLKGLFCFHSIVLPLIDSGRGGI